MALTSHASLLTVADGGPVSVANPSGDSDILLVCEHASNRIPVALDMLGLEPEVLQSHIAWDPGAIEVAMAMAEILDATVISQNFSRLVYDCNRAPGAHDAMPAISEIYEVPGNQSLSELDQQRRIIEIYTPFHETVADTIEQRTHAGRHPVIVTIHSFTPVYHGAMREVELGILHDWDTRLADAMLDNAPRFTDKVTRRNEPYGPGQGVMHTIDIHAAPRDLLNVMIEVRNDLIADEAGQVRAANELVAMLMAALGRPVPQTLSLPARAS